VLKLKHLDEAENQLEELSARDIDLRGEILAVEVSERGEPALEVSGFRTPTLAEKAAAERAEKAAAERAAESEVPGDSGHGDDAGAPVEPDSATTV
jgi:hypothetical protein